MPWTVEVPVGALVIDDRESPEKPAAQRQPPPRSHSGDDVGQRVVRVTHEVPCEKIVHVVVDRVVIQDKPVFVENTVIKEIEKLVEVPVERAVWTEIEVPVDHVVKVTVCITLLHYHCHCISFVVYPGDNHGVWGVGVASLA